MTELTKELPYSRQTKVRYYEGQIGALADILGTTEAEMGEQWIAWARAVTEAAYAEPGDYVAIGRLVHAALEVARL